MTLSRLMTAMAAATLLLAGTTQATTLTTVATFNASQSQFPENLVIDRQGNIFVSLLLSNEVQKITPAGVQTTYATFNGGPGSLTAGLVIDDETGDLYVAYDSAGQNSVIYVCAPGWIHAGRCNFPRGRGAQRHDSRR